MDTLLEIISEKAPAGLAFFAPQVHNKIMDKKFDNAVSALRDIESRLAEFGLKIDYLRYFEQHLKIPLALMNGLSEEDRKEPREVLQNLFLRHLAGNYDDDARYAEFISIIKILTPLDLKILKLMWPDASLFPFTQSEYEASEFSRLLGEDWSDIEQSISTLTAQYLIAAPHSASETPVVGESKPRFTALGRAFMRACIDEWVKPQKK